MAELYGRLITGEVKHRKSMRLRKFIETACSEIIQESDPAKVEARMRNLYLNIK